MADSLTPNEVAEIALLARLELDSDEIERLRVDLSAILEHMEVLGNVDTSAVEPMTHAVPMSLRLRADEVAPSMAVETALAAAPAQSEDHFQVPHIIKGNRSIVRE